MVKEYKPLYSVKEVSTILMTNVNFVYEIINKGELPYLLINNAKKVRGSDLEKYIESYPVAKVQSQ